MALWRRSIMMERFPAYKLEELTNAPAELWAVAQLRSVAERTKAGRG